MNFKLPVLAVHNIATSVKFYQELFDQTVLFNFGENITFCSGFSLQESFDRLIGIPSDQIQWKPNNMELYFEVDDFTAFLQKLHSYPSIKYVHPPLTHDWCQRVVRIYDPDNHIIEIGESMEVVVLRCLEEGKPSEETARITQHPLEFINACISKRETHIASKDSF